VTYEKLVAVVYAVVGVTRPTSKVDDTSACVKFAENPEEDNPDDNTVTVTPFKYVPKNMPDMVTVCPDTKAFGLVDTESTLEEIENDCMTTASAVPIPVSAALAGFAHTMPVPELVKDVGMAEAVRVLIKPL
jgi:hypothetical protein